MYVCVRACACMLGCLFGYLSIRKGGGGVEEWSAFLCFRERTKAKRKACHHVGDCWRSSDPSPAVSSSGTCMYTYSSIICHMHHMRCTKGVR